MKLWPQAPVAPGKIATAQCPNCGAYGEQTGSLWRDLRTGKTFNHTSVLESQTAGLIVAASFIIASIAVTWLLGPDTLWLALIVSGILALATIAFVIGRRVGREAHAARVLTYRCVRCLHQWDQQDGKPPPRYNEAQEILEDYRAVFGSGRGDDGGT